MHALANFLVLKSETITIHLSYFDNSFYLVVLRCSNFFICFITYNQKIYKINTFSLLLANIRLMKKLLVRWIFCIIKISRWYQRKHFMGLFSSKERNIYQVYEIWYKDMSAYRYAIYRIIMRFVIIRCVLSVLTKIQQFQKTQQQNIFRSFFIKTIFHPATNSYVRIKCIFKCP